MECFDDKQNNTSKTKNLISHEYVVRVDKISPKQIEIKTEPFENNRKIIENINKKVTEFKEDVDSEFVNINDYLISCKTELQESNVCRTEKECNMRYVSSTLSSQHTENIAALHNVENSDYINKILVKDEQAIKEDKLYDCLECTYKSNSLRDYLYHLPNHNNTKMFVCNICNKQFYEGRSLQLHILIHTVRRKLQLQPCSGSLKVNYKTYVKCGFDQYGEGGTKIYQCNVCHKQFKWKGQLKIHSTTHSKEKRFQCAHCDYRATRKGYLILHWRDKHLGEKKYKCTECPYQTSVSTNLKKHSKQHLESKPKIKKRLVVNKREFNCPYCAYQTKVKSYLKSHLSVHDNAKPFECDMCHESFKRKLQLQRHIVSNHINKVYKCSVCEYETYDEQDFQKHIAVHDHVKPYKCSVCGKQYKLKRLLKTHSFQHIEETRYQCAHCDYKTNRREYMIIHWRGKHLGEKKHKCSECPYKTTISSHLKRHLKTHSIDASEIFKKNPVKNNQKFKCSQCEYQTGVKGRLKRHLSVHDNIKPFKCGLCHQFFKRKDQLQQHTVSKHIHDKEYKCLLCNYKINIKQQFEKHLLTHVDVKVYDCNMCNKQIKVGYRLSSHSCIPETKPYFNHLLTHNRKENEQLTVAENSQVWLKEETQELQSDVGPVTL